MRRYYLHTRHNGIYYVEFVTPEGNKLSARSTSPTLEHLGAPKTAFR